MVTLAAELTKDEYGSYLIEPSIEMEQGRAFAQLTHNQDVNLVIGGVDKERERTARTIYFPLSRGLLGFRLCLINESKPNIFYNLESVKDFKKASLTIGLGTHWPDRKIIESNGLQTMPSPVSSSLIDMLSAHRFDCFLRSIGEVEYELKTYADRQVMLDEHIAFIYPFANFIFINPANERLHERLRKGLLLASKNNKFNQHFNKHYRNLLYTYKLYERKLFFLKNPNLSEKASNAINQYGIASFTN